MNLQAATTPELIAALAHANANPADQHHITLTGTDYVVETPLSNLFGPVAFPLITGDVLIEGGGATISRAENAPPFRLFAVNANAGNPNASLELRDVMLVNGLAAAWAAARLSTMAC